MWPAVQDDQRPTFNASSNVGSSSSPSDQILFRFSGHWPAFNELLFSCLTIQTAIYLFIITMTRAPFYPWFWGHDLNLGSRLRRRRILYSLLIKMTLAGDANWGQKGWEQSISRICQKKSLWRHPCPHTHTLTVSDQILSGFSWQAINGLIFLLAI